MTDEELFFKDIEELETLCKASLFHLRGIEQEDDPEVVAVHIMALGELQFGPPSVEQKIREGWGDFAKVQEKCIRMGLV